MSELVIFDLDGTLTDASHRQPLVQGDKKDWRAFYAAAKGDVPKLAAHAVLKAMCTQGYEIWIWSGRSDEVKLDTLLWLEAHGLIEHCAYVKMRREGDFTPDDKLKMGWYDALSDADRKRLLLTFDDRDRMVNAWRSRGVTCFQVAPGNF